MYEYVTLKASNERRLEDQVNQASRDGWEVVSYSVRPSGGFFGYYTLTARNALLITSSVYKIQRKVTKPGLPDRMGAWASQRSARARPTRTASYATPASQGCRQSLVPGRRSSGFSGRPLGGTRVEQLPTRDKRLHNPQRGIVAQPPIVAEQGIRPPPLQP